MKNLKEIVTKFSNVCFLFAICSESNNVVKTLCVGNTQNKQDIIKEYIYKCLKIEKLNIYNINHFRDLLIKYHFSNLKCVKCLFPGMDMYVFDVLFFCFSKCV